MSGSEYKIETDERIHYIDMAKGICISLMVLGHSYSRENMILQWLNSFHMPFFFIMSGFLYRAKESVKVCV